MRLQFSTIVNDRQKDYIYSNPRSPTKPNQSSHPANSNTQYPDMCGACHTGGENRCFKLHPELKDQQPNTNGIKQPSNDALTWNSNTLDIDKGGVSQGAINLDYLKIASTVLFQAPIAMTIPSIKRNNTLTTLRRQQIPLMT